MANNALESAIREQLTQAEAKAKFAMDNNTAQIWCRHTAAEAKADGFVDGLKWVLRLIEEQKNAGKTT